MTDTNNTTDSERWLVDAYDLVRRCVPEASERRVQAAAHKIVEQIARLWCWTRFDG